MRSQQKIVIAGGGFAGINLANKLANKEGFHITLVDKNNYNFFPPLLYQVATGFLAVDSISYPFRKLFVKKKNIQFRLGELLEIVAEENKVVLSNGELFYDFLVISTGAETNYFGNENIQHNALPMKTIDDAIDIRNFMLQAMEEASLMNNEDEIQKQSVVIAGGGPTGVEIAGMFSEMKKHLLAKEYPELNAENFEIHLISGSAELLSPMTAASQKYTYDTLVKMGVKVRLSTVVEDYQNDTVVLKTGETIKTKSLIWAAGVRPNVLTGLPENSYGKGNRLLVDEFNKVQNTGNIYAIGDNCIQTTDSEFPNGHPQVAQVAIQQGKNLANNFIAQSKNKPLKHFAYSDRGSMAIIGINKAVLDFPKPKFQLNGFIAFAAWLFIHLISLVNYRNRVSTFYSWVTSYITKDQSLRMIIRPTSAIIKKIKSGNDHNLVNKSVPFIA